ncbi:glutathione S-transferase family protein [Litoribrevibacter albus]|uniref:Glutathione S-transferase n=1 Tax=Litoribrevibacter albus TaxID=1473156 RepID=A0AA37SCZ4_9GAMM|nr:glutathione S-transferase family protein [Litoribrevibacter albus]GLQ32269.1 glutathione S-transferase [Litoribrevibacter albus]
MIKVYGYPKTRALRVTWLLEELELDYEYHLINFAKGESQSPEFLAINPAGKVPALEIDGQVIFESGAIVTFLADKYASGKLIPNAGTVERARHDQWSYFVLTELEQPLWTMGKHKFAIPKEYRVAEVLPTAAWEFQRALTVLSKGLGDKEYILGDSFSVADLLIAQTLRWGLSFKQAIEQPNLIDYLNRMESRSARSLADQRETQALAEQG